MQEGSAEGTVQWRAFVSAMMNLRVPLTQRCVEQLRLSTVLVNNVVQNKRSKGGIFRVIDTKRSPTLHNTADIATGT
jgi:hypothetical protein